MRRILPIFLLAFLAAPALWAQNGVRWDLGGPIAGVSTIINQPSIAGQNANYLVAIAPVQLNWCGYPANSTQGTPCTNYSTTYTDLTLSTTCPSTQPIVLQQTNICTSSSDAFGNLGVNSPGGTYTYTLTYGSTTYGPYTVTLGGSGGGSGGSPNASISFTASNSVVLATSFTSSNLVWECYDSANPANSIYPANVTVNPSTFSVTFTFTIAQSGYCVVNGSGGGGGGGGSGILLGTTDQVPAVNLAGTLYLPQTKASLDVRAFGVVGNGTTDDTTAMQNAANAACNSGGVGTALIIPNGARIKVSSTIVFSKCWGVSLSGQNSQGQTTYGANSNAGFVWAGSAGGTVLEVDRTRDSSFGNFSIQAGTANRGLLIDSIAPVTTITTNNSYPNLSISNGVANASWIGVDICPTAPGNCEAQNFTRFLENCGGSTPTSTSNGIGIKYETVGGAEPYYEEIRDTEITSCSVGIDLEGGFNVNIDGGLMGGNYTDLLVNAGQLIRYANFRTESAIASIVIGNPSFSSAKDITIESNSFSGLTNSTTTISFPFGTTGGIVRLIKNAWDNNATVTPFGPSGAGVFVGTVDSQDNVYPSSSANCVASGIATGHGYSSLNDTPAGGSCKYGAFTLGGSGPFTSNAPTGFPPFSVASNTASSTTSGGGLNVAPSAASDPATCTVGQLYWNTVLPGLKECSATNTWTGISGGSGGGNPTLDNCSPDQTGNSFYSVLSLTNYFYASWQFVFSTATYINCTVYIPTAQTGATLVLDIAANDGTAGHTASFQTCDQVINSGTINTGALTCAAAQTFTTTSTAYNRVTLTFNVQSTLSNGSMLVVKILTSTTGTAPTANLLVYPHFVL